MRIKTAPYVSVAALLWIATANAKTVHYDLIATRNSVNLSGKKTVDFALMVNGTIPAPTLEFTEGDEAEIVVTNRIPKEEFSIHWHGILLPPEMDGVPYVTTPPIHSGASHTFRFTLRQSGTYWYHSHTNVQEQKGVYGAIVIHPKAKSIAYDRDVVAVLSDWSDENATQILKNLRKDGDYYVYKKGTMRSWLGAVRGGSLGNFLFNEWIRMGGMDYSDVGYDAFLINGKKDFQLAEAKPGEKIRLRFINAAASTYFYVSLGQGPMKVISADGVDIEPLEAREILMGMAETYDVLFEVPEEKNYELKITAQDGTGSASAWIGRGEKIHAPVKPKPDLYATMDHSEHGGHAGHAGYGPVTVDQISALQETSLPEDAHVHEVKLVLNGDMSRYVWHINGKAIYQDRTIEIREGDVVRFTLVNKTMMHHPMHLHGHFFRVLTSAGVKSPLKHTVDVGPHSTRTIEFLANEPGEWMLHCHNLYHLKTGMARVVKYESFTPKPEIAQHQKHDPHLHDHFYFHGQVEGATNHGQGRLRLMQTWNELEGRVETRKDDSWNVEADVFYRRWWGNYLNFNIGWSTFDEKHRALAGIGYTLPFLIETAAFVDHRGKFRVDAEKRFQWTKYFFSDAEMTWRQEEGIEWEASLMFSPAWAFAVGAKFTNGSIGGGVSFQF